MIVEPKDLEAIRGLDGETLHLLQKSLGPEGITLSEFTVGGTKPGEWRQSHQFKFTLSVARIANRLSHGRHHNSYVASVQEIGRIYDLLAEKCRAVGVHLDPLRLLTIRLDLFLDALLDSKTETYVNMLMLLSSSARLHNGLSYANGILGAGKSYGWTLYDKGNQLLELAEKGKAGAPTLDELMEERGLDEWPNVTRLEMRWTRSSAVRRGTKKRSATKTSRAKIKRGAACKGRPAGGKSRRARSPRSTGADAKPTQQRELVESLASASEDAMPSFTLGELIAHWDQLPELFRKTARRRCLPLSMCELEEKVAAAQSRGSTSKCPRAQWQASFTAALRRRNITLAAGFFEKLHTSLALSASRGQDWLLTSPICRLRHYLNECAFKPNDITYYSKTFLWAELEYAACNGSDLLRQIQEFEKAYLLDADDVLSQEQQTELTFESQPGRESGDSIQLVNRVRLPRSFRQGSSSGTVSRKRPRLRPRARTRHLTSTRHLASVPVIRPRHPGFRNRDRRRCRGRAVNRWSCWIRKGEEHPLTYASIYRLCDHRFLEDGMNDRPP